MSASYAGKVAVITGAASGIGLELARQGARRGMRLVLADLSAYPEVPQPDDGATYAKKIDKAETRLDFSQDKGWSKWLGTQQLLGYYEYKDQKNYTWTYRHTALGNDKAWQQKYANTECW